MEIGLIAVIGVISFLCLLATIFKDQGKGVRVEFANDAHQSTTLVGWSVSEAKAALIQWDRWRLWNHNNVRCRLNGTFLDDCDLCRTLLCDGDTLEFAVILASSGVPSGYVEATFSRQPDGSYSQVC